MNVGGFVKTTLLWILMRKAEVKTLVPFILRSLQVCFSFLFAHAIPDIVSLLIDPHVEQLSANEKHKIISTNC